MHWLILVLLLVFCLCFGFGLVCFALVSFCFGLGWFVWLIAISLSPSASARQAGASDSLGRNRDRVAEVDWDHWDHLSQAQRLFQRGRDFLEIIEEVDVFFFSGKIRKSKNFFFFFGGGLDDLTSLLCSFTFWLSGAVWHWEVYNVVDSKLALHWISAQEKALESRYAASWKILKPVRWLLERCWHDSMSWSTPS